MESPVADSFSEQNDPATPSDQAALATVLKISELFYSLQGEGLTSGLATVFVRLTGCPLRCSYCDTSYAFSGGEFRTIGQIINQVEAFQTSHITVTGGEPLAQPDCLKLLTELCDRGYKVSLETSGERDIAPVDSRVVKVMDLKTPGSGESHRNRLQNIPLLSRDDQVKFVISDREDYRWAVDMIAQHRLDERCHVLFSPVFGVINPADMAEWMLADRVPARLQLQLHKSLWGDEPGR